MNIFRRIVAWWRFRRALKRLMSGKGVSTRDMVAIAARYNLKPGRDFTDRPGQ